MIRLDFVAEPGLLGLIAELEKHVRRQEESLSPRRTSVLDIAQFFQPMEACTPCGEPVTTLSTCTRIDTKTNPTVGPEKIDSLIIDDIQALWSDIKAL
jgi:hypothetical protein